LVVCSHSASALTRAEFSAATLVAGSATNIRVHAHLAAASPPAPLAKSAQESLLPPQAWNRWGGMERDRAADTVAAQEAAICFAGDGDSGLWQDVGVEPGQAYRFTVLASCSGGGGSAPAHDTGFVELRLESPLD